MTSDMASLSLLRFHLSRDLNELRYTGEAFWLPQQFSDATFGSKHMNGSISANGDSTVQVDGVLRSTAHRMI
jgi:hypothetical protein